MELHLTTARALKYEDRTGRDIFEVCQEIAQTQLVKISTVVQLFSAMGDNYTPEVFDTWNVPFSEKVVAIIEEINNFTQGKK